MAIMSLDRLGEGGQFLLRARSGRSQGIVYIEDVLISGVQVTGIDCNSFQRFKKRDRFREEELKHQLILATTGPTKQLEPLCWLHRRATNLGLWAQLAA